MKKYDGYVRVADSWRMRYERQRMGMKRDDASSHDRLRAALLLRGGPWPGGR